MWAVLTKDRFPTHEYNKLPACKIGPLEIVEKIDESNAYRLQLPSYIHTSDVFNIKHLIPYSGDKQLMDSRANLLHLREDDVVHKEWAFQIEHPKAQEDDVGSLATNKNFVDLAG